VNLHPLSWVQTLFSLQSPAPMAAALLNDHKVLCRLFPATSTTSTSSSCFLGGGTFFRGVDVFFLGSIGLLSTLTSSSTIQHSLLPWQSSASSSFVSSSALSLWRNHPHQHDLDLVNRDDGPAAC
jgi:hypothetical protein